MPPSKVMLIRHGEKPADDGSMHGVDEAGRADANELSVRGWQRAGALARLFVPRAGTLEAPLETPNRLYAPGPSPASPSKRSLHTRFYAQGDGIHDVHMNQGSTKGFVHRDGDDSNDHNDVWQDGVLLVRLPEDRWVAYFSAFTQQLVPTDELGNPTDGAAPIDEL